MEGLIRKFGNVTIDVREIACIGEHRHSCGPAVFIDIYLKQGAKVSIDFESEEMAKKEIKWLILIWEQATK
jgi:hypothetical protein